MTIEKWEIQYGRLLPLILHHYVDKGESTWSEITLQTIEDCKNQMIKEQAKAEKEGKIMIMTPDFVYELNMACYNLFREDEKIKQRLIKKYYA